MAHTFDPANAARLEDVSRYRFCSRDELVDLVDPTPDDIVLDLGSGTGFYTSDLAPFVGSLIGIDIQPVMHQYYLESEVPENVSLVSGDIDHLPLRPDSIDAAFSTMTYHEFATEAGLAEVARVLKPGGRFVTVDWSAAGRSESGPPLSERQDANSATAALEPAGFEIVHGAERPETFVLVAERSR